jgi:putative oxidoreductase
MGRANATHIRKEVAMTDSWTDTGLLALRVGVGGALAAHGAQKLFGWFGGYGPSATGQWMDSLGFAGSGRRNAILAGLAEFGGGTLLALGLATGPAGAAVAGEMIVAGSTHAPNGFFNASGGYELPATFGLVGTALALSGPGRFSLDHLLGHAVNRKWMAFAALASTVGSAAYLISTRQQPPAAPAEVDAAESATDEAAVADSDGSTPAGDA